ncbi:unnamed protein product [Prorocentrum cordatum]|uniref:RING-type domain-containing protein n=1 Tax=Prorocentrum cordatum TaxID=2364126 RepID=A0ABN9TBF1_9DINO|nr:unnamed protein product [Polarella glacialis]
MAERRGLCAVCPACLRPLDSDLVASGCNHVFHRACLADAGLKQCPKCGDAAFKERTQTLYSVSFGACGDCAGPGSAAPAVGVVDDSDDDVIVDTVEARISREVTQILQLERSVKSQRRELDDKQRELAQQKEQLEQQEQKRASRVQDTKRLAAQRLSQQQELETARLKCQSLQEELNRLRLRDTILDYTDLRRSSGDESALQFLTTMVSTVQDPSKVIVDMTRLRGHYRTHMTKWLKETGAAKQQLSKVRRELEEQKRAAAEAEARLERTGGAPADRSRSPAAGGRLPRR